MPMLFYGTLGERKRPTLYAANLRPIETSVFDSFKIGDLAPLIDLDSHRNAFAIANHWWFERRKHTAISWHHPRGTEQTIFLPGLLDWMAALEVSRIEFADLIPSPIIFRFNNYEGAYLYE